MFASGWLMSRRGSSSSKRRPPPPPMPTAKELGELERLKQNEVTLKTKIRSVRPKGDDVRSQHKGVVQPMQASLIPRPSTPPVQ